MVYIYSALSPVSITLSFMSMLMVLKITTSTFKNRGTPNLTTKKFKKKTHNSNQIKTF
jgi:hypothetical protein